MADEDNVERTDSRSASHKRNDASGDADARSDAGTQSDTDAQNDDDSQSDAETQSDDDTQNDADAQSNAETQDDDDTQSDDDAQSDTDSSISEEAAMPLPDHVKNPPPSEETQEETLPTQTQGAPPPPTGTEPAPPPPVELPPSSPIRVEMPFLDHLEELRWRILKSLAALIIGAVVCFSFSDPIFNLLKYPYEDAVFSLESDRSSGAVRAIQNLLQEWMGQRESGAELGDEVKRPLPIDRRLQSLKVMTYFFVSLQIAFLGGLVLALPVLFYQIWQFVAPGLLKREKRLMIPVVLLSVICFSIGALIAYWIVLPLGLRFFLALEPPDMTSQWAVDEYMSFVLRLIFGFGIVFEMPVLALFFSRIGLLTPEFMRRIRRFAVVAIFILGAFFTPPDPLSQMLMALPLLLLYEISIWVCKISSPHRKKPKEPKE
jgi:sec-independent protein translocase protein TatC